jgi:hypothetical protein
MKNNHSAKNIFQNRDAKAGKQEKPRTELRTGYLVEKGRATRSVLDIS